VVISEKRGSSYEHSSWGKVREKEVLGRRGRWTDMATGKISNLATMKGVLSGKERPELSQMFSKRKAERKRRKGANKKNLLPEPFDFE